MTPLQAYFADIYASLQTELYHTKRQHRQDSLLLEKQQALIEQYKQEAIDERTARRNAENSMIALQEQYESAEKAALKRVMESEASLEALKGEFKGHKAAFATNR